MDDTARSATFMDDTAPLTPGDPLTCRICRSEGNPDEPLFHPCKCSGSIKHVHQDCLMEWLSHSNKKHCELCKTPFRFTKLYDANMPAVLPWRVFFQRAVAHVGHATVYLSRASLVAVVWMILLPWLIRWAWCWMFWIADAGWARDVFLSKMRINDTLSEAPVNATTLDTHALRHSLQEARAADNETARQAIYSVAVRIAGLLGVDVSQSAPRPSTSTLWPQAHPSVFSSWTYLSSLTPHPRVNRILLDIFEGQLITCVVILGFILVFLIREWVVQQQPVVNLDQLNNARGAMDAVEQLDRARQRDELLEEARRALRDLQAAENSAADLLDSLADSSSPADAIESESGEARRPRMPDRDTSSRATQIQRFLEEADAILKPNEPAVRNTESGLEQSDSDKKTSPPFETESASNTSHSKESDGYTEDLPIANAGPEAKVNIKRSGNGKARTVPPPVQRGESATEDISDPLDALRKHLQAISKADTTEMEPVSGEANASGLDVQSSKSTNDNPFHPDGPEPINGGIDSHSEAQSEVPATEDTAESDDNLEESIVLDGDTQDSDGTTSSEEAFNDAEARRLPEDSRAQSSYDKLTDWFWDGIEPTNEPEQPVPFDEERLPDGDVVNEAPFVPFDHGHPAPAPAGQAHPQPAEHDPEVVAAAAQAGLDAEAVEDAEDIEGIFELIGLQGPLAGLFHTSMFCLVLVTGTVLGAVLLPYVWGKLVLSFIGSPAYFLMVLPLQVASFVADLLVDLTLFFGGWLVTLAALALEVALTALHTAFPKLGTLGTWITKITNAALAETGASGDRLRNMFITSESIDPLGINAGFLGASVHSHAALRDLQQEVDAVLSFFGGVLGKTFHVIIQGNYHGVWQGLVDTLAGIPLIPARLSEGIAMLHPYLQAFLDTLKSIKSGALLLPVPAAKAVIDPALVYWSSADRSLAVVSGYLALALLAAIYVAVDTPITQSRSGQRTEKIIRDSLRQAGGVLKVILIISIEMLAFPLYCGLLLDVAFLPLFADTSMASRLAFAAHKPYIFGFVHWFIGTCYMFHFALFVGMCRKILRKGVLWFIRDPDDPTFHPVRDVLERNVTTQLKKIGFAALVYGALVILCLGGVIWSIGRVFQGIFPLHWVKTEPFLEFPIDLLLYNFLTPLVIRLFKPSDAVNAMYAWWLRKCARGLRLSHFLFDDHRNDEEGFMSDKPWLSFLARVELLAEDRDISTQQSEVGYRRDGRYVLTPSTDQYRPPKPDEIYLHTTEEDVFIADKDGNRNDQFAKICVPPHFRLRVTLFMVCLWVFSAFIWLCATLVPLVLGRRVLSTFAPQWRINDIYAYSIGAYSLATALVVAIKSGSGVKHLKEKAKEFKLQVWLRKAAAFLRQAMDCAYVYGWVGLVIPALIALILQLYLMVPMHTYAASVASDTTPTTNAASNANYTAINATASFVQSKLSMHNMSTMSNASSVYQVPRHNIHVLQDFALGVLFQRIIARYFSIDADSHSRGAEAWRRIVRNGRTHPDSRLVTRVLVVPTVILAIMVIVLPPVGAWLSLAATRALGYAISARRVTEVYRYSYPAASAALVMGLFLREVGKATNRWRARIRDEVYLVGERLHNFGEKKPPFGSRSMVVRRDVLGRV